ncbi:MAG: hypothetical protein FWD57_13975 [Polyangiaceae bacterium]|nr:hypothetical protein [Polyangiaceae bacterium]
MKPQTVTPASVSSWRFLMPDVVRGATGSLSAYREETCQQSLDNTHRK